MQVFKLKVSHLFLLMTIISLFTTSCIPNYKTISTQQFSFKDITQKQQVSIVCSDTLLFPKQKKYSFIPVQIENKGSAPFELTRQSVSVFSNYETVDLVETEVYLKKTRKKYWGYTVLASLGVANMLGISEEGLNPEAPSIMAIVAMSIASFYIYKTVKHNRMQKEDLQMLDLNGQSILPGEIKRGLLVLDRPNCKNISIRIE